MSKISTAVASLKILPFESSHTMNWREEQFQQLSVRCCTAPSDGRGLCWQEGDQTLAHVVSSCLALLLHCTVLPEGTLKLVTISDYLLSKWSNWGTVRGNALCRGTHQAQSGIIVVPVSWVLAWCATSSVILPLNNHAFSGIYAFLQVCQILGGSKPLYSSVKIWKNLTWGHRLAASSTMTL